MAGTLVAVGDGGGAAADGGGPQAGLGQGGRIECDRCGKATLMNEAHTGERRGTMLLRVLISRMRHESCGGRAGRAKLMTGIDRVSSRPVRRIVLMG